MPGPGRVARCGGHGWRAQGIGLVVLAAATLGSQGVSLPDWENPQAVGINRQEPHASLTPFPDRASALTRDPGRFPLCPIAQRPLEVLLGPPSRTTGLAFFRTISTWPVARYQRAGGLEFQGYGCRSTSTRIIRSRRIRRRIPHDRQPRRLVPPRRSPCPTAWRGGARLPALRRRELGVLRLGQRRAGRLQRGQPDAGRVRHHRAPARRARTCWRSRCTAGPTAATSRTRTSGG